jgi:hypothetical protein
MLIYLFFIPFALGSYFPSPNVPGVGISFPQNVGDSTICLNCVDFIKLDLPAAWVCYAFQNNECVSEDVSNIGYNNCSTSQAQLINSTYPQYASQCQVYVYEIDPSNGTDTTTCTKNGNITTCIEMGSFNNGFSGGVNCTENGNITTCVEIGNFNATCTENGNTTTCVESSVSNKIHINWLLISFVLIGCVGF